MRLHDTSRDRLRFDFKLRDVAAYPFVAADMVGGDKAADTLEDIDHRTGGPARYARIAETGQRVGFITPLTHNFCESCNRVRLTCTGMLYMCLGQDDSADLRAPLRASPDDALLLDAIDEAIGRKPKGHDFIIDRRHTGPAVQRHMSVTGG